MAGGCLPGDDGDRPPAGGPPIGKEMRHTLTGCFLLMLAVGGWFRAPAQLTEADTLPLAYRVGLSGSWISGNVNRLLVVGTGDLSSMHPKWAFRTGNTYQFGTFGKVRTEGDLFSKNFIYLSPRHRWYAYAMAWIETNVRRRYPLRVQVGPGVTATLLRKQDHLLKLSFSTTWENIRFQGTTFSDTYYNGRSSIEVIRGTVRIFGQSRLAAGNVRLRYEFWGQSAFQRWSNYRLHGDVAADFPISKQLSFRVAVNYNDDAVVLAGVRQRDTFITFGFNWSNF
ncbi:MAG: hypothetical protein RLZZ165_909 [Bacteroidota bacterium]|jgi:hypothetical protein